MPLTECEIEATQQLLSQMKQNVKAWSVARWICLLIVVMNIVGVIWAGYCIRDTWIRSLHENPSQMVNQGDLFSSNATILILGLLASIILIFSLSGLAVLSLTLGKWNQNKREMLIIRIAESWLESQTQDSTSKQ